VLLGAVVEVAFEPAPLAVLSGDESLPGGAEIVESSLEVGAETDVLEDEAGLMREVVHELDLDRCERLAASLGDGECAEDIALVTHEHDAIGVRDARYSGSVELHRRVGAGVSGNAAARRSAEPLRNHTSAISADVPSQRTRAMRGSTSSLAYDSATRPENSDRTSYGVARLP
jgi:hypothetical protein